MIIMLLTKPMKLYKIKNYLRKILTTMTMMPTQKMATIFIKTKEVRLGIKTPILFLKKSTMLLF